MSDIPGMDGARADVSSLAIPPSSFEVADLTDPPLRSGSFDLVISLEVAEHLPSASADRFVRFLTSLGPAIAFSAATVGQGLQIISMSSGRRTGSGALRPTALSDSMSSDH